MDDEKILVSVILPAYNSEGTIAEAIDSILNQTHKDLELIIINDGSSDGTKAKILELSDPRIRYYENDKNMGLIMTLNRGIEYAKGKYIARMDADDISHPDRIKRQVRYLEVNTDVILCGTDITYFGGYKGRFSRAKFKKDSQSIKDSLLVNCSIVHPSVMIRCDILRRYKIRYNPNFKNAEDYKLWVDLSEFGEFHNLSSKLLRYRISSRQVSNKGQSLQIRNSEKCQNDYFKKRYPNFIFPEIVDTGVLKQVRYIDRHNKYIIPYFYLRITNYGIKEFLYYLFSFDWLRLERRENIIVLLKFFRLR